MERYHRIVSSDQQLSSTAANTTTRSLPSLARFITLIFRVVSIFSGMTIVFYLVSACLNAIFPQLKLLAGLFCITLELFLLVFNNYLDFSIFIYVIKSVDQSTKGVNDLRRIEFKKLFFKATSLLSLTIFTEFSSIFISFGVRYYNYEAAPTSVMWSHLGCYSSLHWWGDTALEKFFGVNLTAVECQNSCWQSDYAYFGISNGNYCCKMKRHLFFVAWFYFTRKLTPHNIIV